MSKTPEEIAAEVFSTDKELRHRALRYIIENFPPRGNRHTLRALQLCFLAGYKAAQDQVADVSKVMPQWISVKDRLPEVNELCIVNTEWRGVVPATYGNESWIFDEGQGWSEKALSYASHWMPLPKPPEEEK